ncbi:beta strand repeat-containing protein [Marinobacter salarius]|uniref:beta strand repeat-containing protein n=1 Tax=Marinobacter salarius TaxID=1420917 RepID=UPI0010A997A2|nr:MULTISPECIES: hypothetical protein [Marinobacter]MBJ7302722.1 hypothetical protein [Marinobacter salarius]HIO30735.1 hypothetical protein [Marinobacter salarius]HIP01766.1 hypothetical protein [Marinobacter salarius]
MASILGKLGIQEGDSYTAAAGSNRAVVVAGTGESAFSSREIVGITFGGVAMTRAAYTGDTETAKGGVYYILESQIPAGSSVIAVDWDGQVHDAFTGAVYTLGGIDQATPVNNFNSAVGVSLFDLDITFNGVDGGVLVAGAGSNSPADTLNQSSTISATTTTVTVDHAQTTAGHEGSAISGVLSAAGSETLGLRYSSETDPVGALAVFNPSGAGPSGPSLDTVPSTAYPGQSRTVLGSGFGATQGTGGLTIGGVSQTITGWSDTSITFTTVLGANSYGTGKVVELTTDAGGTDTGAIELVADTAGGFGVVTMSSPNTTDESSVAFGATPTVVTGDQFEWEDFNALGNLVIDAEGFVSSVDTEGAFRGRFWDASDGTWGSVNTFTASATDETAPTISSAAVPTAGNNIAVQMSESMQVGAGGSGGWTISLAGVSVSSASVDGTDDTIVNLTPSRTLTDEDTLTIGYTQPGDGFQDQAATPNDLATLSGQVVTNNSTQQPPDVTGPVTQSVGVPTAGTYAIGDDLNFTVNWDEAVTVTGTPALNLDIGGSSRQANYASGSGTAALVFTYTVQEGDEDTDGIAVSSLTLDGGTLQDSSGNNATLTLNSVGDTSGVLVDGIRPVISINALTTTDTTPLLTGSAGDAVSLTLVVNSVTYNPTPSGGTWSQQLPELALDTYPVTLNGEDANGNAAVEAQAVLAIVDEIVTAGNGLFRPLFRANAKSTFKNLFR